uniref:NADH-ubiquinone oxidoreductase chain 5 n=1 Tax=Pseudophacopteron sp. DMP-2018 TaxID=2908812 RepID=A0A344A2P1_9HEMI|nr:NADH dehydrogenase subunit 5 [Pseudophacopteron sp. DMP-2018]
MKMISMFYYVSMILLFMFMIMLGFIVCCNTLELNLFLEFELLKLNSVNFMFILYLDWMSVLFSLIVVLISLLVMLYSKSYMGEESMRFIWLTLSFIIFMLFMIWSPSILSVILGWDGLGLISYCLILYYQSKSSFYSGFITAASNRLGDSMLMVGITMYLSLGNYMFWENTVGFLFFFIACLTKSAQFPFSAWLPLAMAAPTPISSLVHSSTLVTAGVYMLIRFNWMLYESLMNQWLMLISLFTIYMAGMNSFYEFDMKRVIALSTLGQLSFMMMILSLGYPYVAFLHLLIHALFKALLFMCAGSIIHSGSLIQDLRKVGNLNMDIYIKMSLNISLLCLMGLPFSSGFYSKDLLLELFMLENKTILFLFMIIGVMITVSYSMRMLKYMTKVNFWLVWIEGSKIMTIPIILLASFNIMGGSVIVWIMMNYGSFIVLESLYKIMPLLMLMMGILFQGLTLNKMMYYYFFLNLMFLMNVTKYLGLIIYFMFIKMKLLDQGWMETTLKLMKKFTLESSFWVGGLVSNYTLYFYSLMIILVLIIV